MTNTDTRWQDLADAFTARTSLTRAGRLAAWARVNRDGTLSRTQGTTEPAPSVAVSANR